MSSITGRGEQGGISGNSDNLLASSGVEADRRQDNDSQADSDDSDSDDGGRGEMLVNCNVGASSLSQHGAK